VEGPRPSTRAPASSPADPMAQATRRATRRSRLWPRLRHADIQTVKHAALAIPALLILLAAALSRPRFPGRTAARLAASTSPSTSHRTKPSSSRSACRATYARPIRPRTQRAGTPAKYPCLPNENGPPYDAYTTSHVFLPAKGRRPLGFDSRILGPEWVSQTGGLRRKRSAVGPHRSTSATPPRRPRSRSTTAATTASQAHNTAGAEWYGGASERAFLRLLAACLTPCLTRSGTT
jgi:hypothetical protein